MASTAASASARERMSVSTTPMTSSETRAMRGRLVRASARFSAITLRRRFEQAIGERRVEHALIGDVAADVDRAPTPTVSPRSAAMSSAMRSDFSKPSRCGSMALALLRIQAGIVGGGAFAEIAAHDQHAVEALHLEAHLELEVAVLVALLRGLARLEDSAHRLQHVRGHRFGPQRVDGAAGNFFFAGVSRPRTAWPPTQERMTPSRRTMSARSGSDRARASRISLSMLIQ